MSFAPPLSASADVFRQLFEEAPIPYHEIDTNGMIVRVNQAECDLFGCTAAELIGRPIWAFAVVEERAASRDAIQAKLRGDIPTTGTRRSFQDAEGNVFTVENFDRLIFDPDGRAIGIRSALIDISSRLAAEAELRDSRRWMAATLASLRDGVIAIDPLGVLKFINRAACQIIGFSEEEAVQCDIAELIQIDGLHINGREMSFKDALLGQLLEPWTAQGWLYEEQSGTRSRIEVSSAPNVDDNQRVLGTVILLHPLAPGTELVR